MVGAESVALMLSSGTAPVREGTGLGSAAPTGDLGTRIAAQVTKAVPIAQRPKFKCSTVTLFVEEGETHGNRPSTPVRVRGGKVAR